MKKVSYIILAIIYFAILYVLKTGFIVSNYAVVNGMSIDRYINQYISIGTVASVSFIIIAILVINWVLSKLIDKAFGDKLEDKMMKGMIIILKKVVRIVVWVVWIMTMLSSLGIDIKAVLAAAGIGWLAFALAAQQTAANIFGAINIIINRPFSIWDRVTLGWFTGEVLDIGFTYIRIKNEENKAIVLVPNSTVNSAAVVNFTIKK